MSHGYPGWQNDYVDSEPEDDYEDDYLLPPQTSWTDDFGPWMPDADPDPESFCRWCGHDLYDFSDYGCWVCCPGEENEWSPEP
jgi:hypothetical protein